MPENPAAAAAVAATAKGATTDNRPFKERKSLSKRRRSLVVASTHVSCCLSAPVARKEEVQGIRSKFPNKIPVIVERFHKERNLPQLDKTKFLVPQELTMSQFVTIIR